MYVSDYDDYLPYTSWSSGDYNHPNWCYSRVHSRGEDHEVTLGQLWPYHKSRTLYFCPSENTNTPYFKLREMKVCSYVMNGSVSAFSDKPGGVRYVSYKMGLFRLDSMLYWEANELLPANYDNVASKPDEGDSQRHNGGIVMGMFGGQTEFIKFKNYALEAGIGGYPDKRPGRMWCNPGSPTGD